MSEEIRFSEKETDHNDQQDDSADQIKENGEIQSSLQRLIDASIKGNITSFEIIGEGFGGNVYLVRVEGGSQDACIIKTVDSSRETAYSVENDDDRVYGSRSSNFQPAYDLLSRNNIAVPQIFSSGTMPDDKGSSFVVMECLEGLSVRESLSHEGENREELQALVGNVLGKIHSITRDYQGWVEMPKSESRNWEEIFTHSLVNRLNCLSDQNILTTDIIEEIHSFIDQRQKEWAHPKEFVLSHLDGLQGLLKLNASHWDFQGVIDIEDHAFTDQRFALAGYELALNMDGIEISPIFWEKYQAQKAIDPTYEKFKSFFQLYYLLVWRDVFEKYSGDAEKRIKAIREIEETISDVIKNEK
jgi:fructosamine-3-kinase